MNLFFLSAYLLPVVLTLHLLVYFFLARDVIYTSRAYLMMPVCPSVCPSVCDVCALWSQGAMDPGYLCMLG